MNQMLSKKGSGGEEKKELKYVEYNEYNLYCKHELQGM